MSSLFDEDAKHTILLAKEHGRKLENNLIALAVDALIFDLSDRRGLKQEWAEIDERTQEEIMDMWEAIIRGCINP